MSVSLLACPARLCDKALSTLRLRKPRLWEVGGGAKGEGRRKIEGKEERGEEEREGRREKKREGERERPPHQNTVRLLVAGTAIGHPASL